MYNIIPLILILVSLSVIIVIVVRKFSVLANLDVDNIPAEREARFKEQIISNRLKRNFYRYWSRFSRGFAPLKKKSSEAISALMRKLAEIKEAEEEESPAESTEQTVDRLFREAEEAARNWELEQAEKNYIRIIGLDSRSIRAFRGLGRVYLEQKNYTEAKQTLEHAVRLMEKEWGMSLVEVEAADSSDQTATDKKAWLAGTYLDLSLVGRAQEDFAAARKNIDRALEIEPNNPRFLDTKLELSIMTKDQEAAWETYAKLAEVNPENQKLQTFKKQIEEIDNSSQ